MPQMTYDQLVDMLTLQKQNLSTYQTEVGATAGDITEVTNDVANLIAAASYADIVNADKQTVFQIKGALFNGDPNVTLADFPAFPAAPTLTAAIAGCLERALARNRRFKAAPGYNVEIGEALGITTGGGEPIDPGTVKPTVEVFAAVSGYLFSAVVAGRAQSDQWQVSVRVVGTTAWQVLGTFTGKSADVTYTAGTGQPVQLDVRVQLRKNNENYGQPSDLVTVTVNP